MSYSSHWLMFQQYNSLECNRSIGKWHRIAIPIRKMKGRLNWLAVGGVADTIQFGRKYRERKRWRKERLLVKDPQDILIRLMIRWEIFNPQLIWIYLYIEAFSLIEHSYLITFKPEYFIFVQTFTFIFTTHIRNELNVEHKK